MERQDASVTDLLNSSNATTIASEKSRVPDAQNNFNLSVKTSMLKLCEILKLSVCNFYSLSNICLLFVPLFFWGAMEF